MGGRRETLGKGRARREQVLDVDVGRERVQALIDTRAFTRHDCWYGLGRPKLIPTPVVIQWELNAWRSTEKGTPRSPSKEEAIERRSWSRTQ